MGQKYTRAETITQIEEAIKDMPSFYRAACVNHTGTTYKYDGNEYYTEVISEYLLRHYDLFDQIKKIPRKDYQIEAHDGTTPRPISNRLEERIALSLYQKGLHPIGKIIDYQIPLKSKQKDDAGKIDLMSFDESTGILRLIELKAPKSKETLLRCVLEIYTYYKTVDIDTLIDNFGLSGKCNEVRICPLFFTDSTQNKEYEDLCYRRHFVELLNKISEESVKVELLRFPMLQGASNVRGAVGCGGSSSLEEKPVSKPCTSRPIIKIPAVEQPNGFPLELEKSPDNKMQVSEIWGVEILDY